MKIYNHSYGELRALPFSFRWIGWCERYVRYFKLITNLYLDISEFLLFICSIKRQDEALLHKNLIDIVSIVSAS